MWFFVCACKLDFYYVLSTTFGIQWTEYWWYSITTLKKTSISEKTKVWDLFGDTSLLWPDIL